MLRLGTPLSPSATRVLLLGSGELGKEVAIELQRLGVEVIAADRYADAPAMQVAHRSHVLGMLDGAAIRALVVAPRDAALDPADEARAVQLCGHAGDILVFDADLLHGASLNPTGARRRSILFGFFAEPRHAAHLATAHLRNVRMATDERFDPVPWPAVAPTA